MAGTGGQSCLPTPAADLKFEDGDKMIDPGFSGLCKFLVEGDIFWKNCLAPTTQNRRRIQKVDSQFWAIIFLWCRL